MESFTNIFSLAALSLSGVVTALSVWRMFRTPDRLTVTRKDNGKTVVLDTRADWREGSKLGALL